MIARASFRLGRPLRLGLMVALGSSALATMAVAGMASAYPQYNRALVAVICGAILIMFAVSRPKAAIVATMAFLPFLGLVRRLLIADAGWTSYDPLLLVAPVVAIVLLLRKLFETRQVPMDLLGRLVAGLLILTLVEVLNPSGNGIVANATGLLFVAAPLLWFFVGRQFANARMVRSLLAVAVVAASVNAFYGIWQTTIGFPSWDQAWLVVARNAGYVALGVGSLDAASQIRAFGTFASAAEYGAYLGMAIVICVSLAGARRFWLLLPASVLVAAIIYESSRTVVVLAVLAIIVTMGARAGATARSRSTKATLFVSVVVIGVGAVIGLTAAGGSSLSRNQAVTGSALLSHQISGLTDPLNPTSSTLGLHWQLALDGLAATTSHPLGLGTGATNLAGTANGGASGDAENDIVNAFVNLGVAGGMLYLSLVALALWRTCRLALGGRDPLVLCVLAMLIVTLGQWVNGGYYAVAPLLWLLIGWIDGHSRWQVTKATTPARELNGSCAVRGEVHI